ncbi:MAG: hypothetical protein QOE90_2053 [Thermoplasmata archaeon]|jgi:hypothetical protein|nr:hypothetical protein [Thermoplasmata archaeon]
MARADRGNRTFPPQQRLSRASGLAARMRLALVLAAAILAAGCVSNSNNAPTPGAPQTASLGGWTIDCMLGSYERANNSSWAQTCEARGSHTPGQKQETWIAINPKNPNNVVIGAKDLNPESSAKCVWNGVAVTHDGGKTWKDVVIGGKYADRDPTSPYYGYACNTDPDFQFTSNGDLHYGVEMYGLLSKDANGLLGGTPAAGLADGFKILLATSHDGGDTWPDVITYQPDILVTTDYSRMTINPVSQAIIEAIGSDSGGRCHVLSSTDGGQTARPFVDVQTQYGAPCNSGAGTAIAVSPKGVVTLVGGQVGYQGDPAAVGFTGGDSSQPIVVRSTDDGLTWTDANAGFTYKPIQPFKESKYRVGSVVELAYDLTKGPNQGLLYASYAAADKDEADIFVRTSKDDGKTWTDAVKVNDDSPGAHQWMSNVAVAGDGSAHVFFFDKRYDPNHVLIDLVHAVSFDAGKTWANERVSTVSFDGNLGKHQEGFPFIGDYIGVACYQDDCWAGFPDASNGASTVIAGAHVHRAGTNSTT